MVKLRDIKGLLRACRVCSHPSGGEEGNEGAPLSGLVGSVWRLSSMQWD